jgi:hypothetical protein
MKISAHDVVVYSMLALTALFSLTLLGMLIGQSMPKHRHELLATRKGLLSKVQAMTLTTPVDLGAAADAVQKVLGAAGTFGKDINAIGPTATAGVFAVFFAIVTVVMALVP